MTPLAQLIHPPDILDDLWQRLAVAADRPDDPWHWPTVATVSPIGAAENRTVVLRRVDHDQRHLYFHCDRRSDKVRSLIGNSSVAWCFWNPHDRLQLRVVSTATLHTADAPAASEWARLSAASRETYAAALGPGTPIDRHDSNAPIAPPFVPPTVPPGPTVEAPLVHSDKARPADTRSAEDNFAVALCTTTSLDWLYLHRDSDGGGHRRIKFVYHRHGVSHQWLAP